MFLFIAGVQPKTVRLGKSERPCPRCGHPELFLRRTDHYFSLFFIPLFRVKKGVPFANCDHCRSVLEESGKAAKEPAAFRKTASKCPDCGRPLEEDFEYCPRCGKKVIRL